jgi:hypothetical protein
MTDETLSHIKLEFNWEASHIVEWFAVDQEALVRAQIWQAQQKKTPGAAELEAWLLTNGGQLDRADGPAVIATKADGSRYEAWFSKGLCDRVDGPAVTDTDANGKCREEWWSKGKFIKEERRANLAAIQGVTLFPPAPI